MAPDNDWLSFSLQSSMEMLNPSSHHHPIPPPSQHFYDNFYAAADDVHGWANQKSESMYSGSETHRHDHPQQNSFSVFNGYMQPPPPKLEDFFSGGDSAETHGDSSLTQIYEHHHNAAYFGGFQANSGSEVDDSAAFQQTESPVESGAELVPYSQSHCPVVDSSNNNSNNTAIVSGDANHKKIADNFGQRTSIYRGVTRHRWTGRYEAHLWDNSCRREGQARKGRQVYLGGYDKEDRAARSYDLAALKYWGSTATTNFPASNYATEIEEMKNATRQEFIASLRRKSSGFSRGASMYRGVTRHHQQGRWQARIGRVAGNKDLYLGTFATEEEAAEAYDIAAIKFRGLNAVTNFEMNRYDVEAIAQSPLPIGGTAKRLKLSLEAQEKFNTTAFHTHLSNGGSSSSISFSDVQSANSAIIPCGVPFDSTSPFYHHNFFHHSTPASESSMTTPMNLMSSTPEFFIWPHQSY